MTTNLHPSSQNFFIRFEGLRSSSSGDCSTTNNKQTRRNAGIVDYEDVKELKSARSMDFSRATASSSVSPEARQKLKRSIGAQVAQMISWSDDLFQTARLMRRNRDDKRRKLFHLNPNSIEKKTSAEDGDRSIASLRQAISCPAIHQIREAGATHDEENTGISGDAQPRIRPQPLKAIVRIDQSKEEAKHV